VADDDDKQLALSSSSTGSDKIEQKRVLDRHLLELLVCPLTKSSLEYRAKKPELISRQAQLAFPIVDGIPLLTPEAARALTDDDA